MPKQDVVFDLFVETRFSHFAFNRPLIQFFKTSFISFLSNARPTIALFNSEITVSLRNNRDLTPIMKSNNFLLSETHLVLVFCPYILQDP